MSAQKLPWLVKERDLRRYLGRAIKACKSGRVVFFNHQYKGTKRMLSLSSFPDSGDALLAASAALAKGEFRDVVLADLPKKKRLKENTH